MNFSKKLALATAGSVLLSATAFADALTAPVSIVPAKNSIYVSGTAGYSALATPDKNVVDTDGIFVTGASHDIGYFAGGLNVGFDHAINNHVLVGAEIGYDYNGQSKYTDTYFNGEKETLKIYSFDGRYLATGTYLFSNGFNVFGKAGAASVYQKIKASDSAGSSGSEDITEFQPMLAAGVGYRIKAANIFVEYSHVFGKDANDFSDLFNSDGSLSHTVAVNAIKAGLAYNFAL